jgi:hypothetical protein
MAQLDDRDQLARRVSDLQKQEEKLVLRWAGVAWSRCVWGWGGGGGGCWSEGGGRWASLCMQKRQQQEKLVISWAVAYV